MSRSKDKGTWAETKTVEYLRVHGFPTAERRALAGTNDLGDILTGPGLAWEVKNRARYAIPEWMVETENERTNANADFGILVVKPAGVGEKHVGDWWCLLSLEQLTRLLRSAGYGDEL
jgi:hypothetical protein